MKQLCKIILIMLVAMILPASAHANIEPSLRLPFAVHLWVLTWAIGSVEGLFLYILFRAWRLRSRTSRIFISIRIFISMIAANIASAWLGMQLVNSRYVAQLMGDVTIENLIPVFWAMVYVTFVITMIIEFPFFLAALYGRKWLVPKALAATIFLHCISYSLLFFFYGGKESMNMVTKLRVVPASAFEMKEDYDLYYISPDGNYVMKNNLAGDAPEEISAIEMEGIPDRLCACPRKVTEEIQEGTDNKEHMSLQRICGESGFDLYVLMNIKGKYKTKLVLEHFSPCSALKLRNGEYQGSWDIATHDDFRDFRSFGDAERWEFEHDFRGRLSVRGIKQVYRPYTSKQYKEGSLSPQQYEQGRYARYPILSRDAIYRILTFFVQWPVRNGTHIAGDYAVFLLGKDQVCILDPEKKRIALIARGFGPVVAKPPLEETPEGINEQNNSLVGSLI